MSDLKYFFIKPYEKGIKTAPSNLNKEKNAGLSSASSPGRITARKNPLNPECLLGHTAALDTMQLKQSS